MENFLRLISNHAFRKGDLYVVLVYADKAMYAHAQSIRLHLMREGREGTKAHSSHPEVTGRYSPASDS